MGRPSSSPVVGSRPSNMAWNPATDASPASPRAGGASPDPSAGPTPRTPGSGSSARRPPLAAYCRWRQAEALVAAGASRAEASRPLREAHAVAARIGAAPLVISVRTAGVHVSHILRKLGAPNRLEAAAIAHRLSPGPP